MMSDLMSSSASAFEAALSSREPIRALVNMAIESLKKGQMESLHDIDIMFIDRFIEFLRYGTEDDLNSFQDAILSFIDSSNGDKLKESKDSEEGKRYFYRWEHFLNLCSTAMENYDQQFTARFIASRKHGQELLDILCSSHADGLRHNELAKRLGLSEQHLSKLLREFQEHGLVIRERRDKVSMVKLGLTGRTHMAEKRPSMEKAKTPETVDKARLNESNHPSDEVPEKDLYDGKNDRRLHFSYAGSAKELIMVQY